MKERLQKAIYNALIASAAIIAICEMLNNNTSGLQRLEQVKAATQNETCDGQYIPPNLDYSAVIKDIKMSEGIAEEESTVKTAENEEDTSSASEKYFAKAVEYLQQAMQEENEADKREYVRKALHAYKDCLKYDAGNLEALLGGGAMATYLGKEEEAKNLLMEAYATYPTNPRVHKALGDYSFKFSNFNNAIEYYNLSLSSGNLEDYATNLATAVCYEKLGDIEKAIMYYKVAQHLNPDSSLANQRLEMYAIMMQDGYEADTRRYEAADKIPEEQDMELEDLIIDAQKIK